jgi:ribosomal-protein-alanine N-acetyltransferase
MVAMSASGSGSGHELVIRTRRLQLVAMTLAHIEAELQGGQALGPLLGVSVPSSWPPGEYDRDAMEFFRGRLLAGGPSHLGWYCWYAIGCDAYGRRDQLLAAAGYFGPPSDGSVEVGYSVIPEARGHGYATEIVNALVGRAFEEPGVRVVIAHTVDSNVPSTRALLRCGFERVGAGARPGTIGYRRVREGA